MAYFDNFPLMIYDAAGTGKDFRLITNLTRKVGFRKFALTNTTAFSRYNIMDGETPESIAHDRWGDPQLHWIILLANNIMDRYHDWPMTYPQFVDFVAGKYTNVNAVHHYEINATSGDTTKTINIGPDNTNHSGATLITNFEYEDERQNELRRILLIKDEFVPLVKKQFIYYMLGNTG
jgi:hypothetical protein